MDKVSKRIKRALRDLAGIAYEVELGRALTALREHFTRWERGDITAFDVDEAIHRYHQGPARELYKLYGGGMLDMVVAHAIVAGVLDRSKTDPEVLTHLSRAISFYESHKSGQ
jgi:hypothetical protein